MTTDTNLDRERLEALVDGWRQQASLILRDVPGDPSALRQLRLANEVRRVLATSVPAQTLPVVSDLAERLTAWWQILLMDRIICQKAGAIRGGTCVDREPDAPSWWCAACQRNHTINLLREAAERVKEAKTA